MPISQNMKYGAVAAIAAAIAVPLGIDKFGGSDGTGAGGGDKAGICLRHDLPIEGATAGTCYTDPELATLLDKPVTTGQNGKFLKLSSPASGAQTPEEVEVKTCRDYLARADQGWYAESGAEQSREGFYVKACRAVELIANGKVAAESHLPKGKSLLFEYDAISADILTRLVEGRPDAPPAPEGTLGQVIASGEAKVLSTEDQQLRLSYANTNAMYEEIARGDFDRDGTEDSLVFMAARLEDGSARWARALLVTRTDPAAPMDVKFARPRS